MKQIIKLRKMHCVQNRIYCHDCNKSYIDRNYSDHLRSQGHFDRVLKKRCCRCNNHNFVCFITTLSLQSDVGIQTDSSVDI